MNTYRDFMDRQQVSEETHRRLLELETQKKTKRKGGTVMKFSALAACAALIVGVGGYALLPGGSAPVAEATPTVQPDDVGQVSLLGDWAAFVAQGPAGDGKLMFPDVSAVAYTDCEYQPIFSQPVPLQDKTKPPEGAFFKPLAAWEVQTIFWGEAGKPEVENPKTDPGDFPLYLMGWAGYTISGEADYDGSGELWQVRLSGQNGDSSFNLTLCPRQFPASCIMVSSDWAVTDVNGTAVTGWRWSDDCDGDGTTEHHVWSRFMTGTVGVDNVGVAFENVNSGGARASEPGGGEATDLGGAIQFNEMLVTQLCKNAPYLGHIAHNDNIPGWWSEEFTTLEATRQGCETFLEAFPSEKSFAKYIPSQGPQGFGEFAASLNYQEGVRSSLSLRWSVVGGYDDVEIMAAYFPEGHTDRYELIDVNVPESYDWRLYDGAICDVVPEQYQMDFYQPTFRAEDMSMEVVKARATSQDTGGERFVFRVLHPDGGMVRYACSGVSAQYVWSLVEATL